ncbi:MAG TPA: gliding motility-associated C-terminal domain-containing protein, partial [Saprospiraceae bacterium]|nr:gliding motility-associated C-terminal domain-containing protein [Saprospiraceae bacterium]
VRPALPPAVISGAAFVCEGDSLALTSNAPVNAVLSWTGPNGFSSSVGSLVIFPATTLNAGAYVLNYELNGCPAPASAPFNVQVQSSLATPAISGDVTSLCLDAPVPVTICIDPNSLTPGGTYTWLLNGTGIGNPTSDSCLSILGSPLQGGINNISVITSLQGCLSDTSSIVSIQADEAPNLNADAGPATLYCPDETIMLGGSNPLPGTGLWTSQDPLVIFSNDADPATTLLPLPSGEYTLLWILSYATCVDYSVDSVTITVITPPTAIPDTVSVPFGQTGEFVVTFNDSLSNEPYILQIVSGPQKGNALHAGNGLFRYTPNIGFVGTDVMTYRVCATDCPGECSDATVIIHVGSESDCFVPTLFTPNEDGINDVLIVPCLETTKYPNNRIIIFNEWGDAVFTASPYNNDWDGRVSGESLPVGTYFYIMDFGDGSTPKRTFLVLER